MMSTNFEQLFDKAFPLAKNTTLTVTEVPERADDLVKLLERAMLRAFDNHSRLVEIHLPMERFPSIESKFWHVPVEDCGGSSVLRLFFEATDEAIAA
jgi:hypothetical protein